VRRLSSGLRVGQASDDAAGLAIREMMRAQVASLHQGIRNANDAISLIQTADGALGIIDEKLIRMKELAEQAATGTYNSDQRILIDAEFLAMGEEIDRIAAATDFNGIKLLDGSLEAPHDGSGPDSTGELKVHVGPGNDLAEDYYYITMGAATTRGLGLVGGYRGRPGWAAYVGTLESRLTQGFPTFINNSGTDTFAVIPKGTKNLVIHLDLATQSVDDSMQLFTADGKHLVGTSLSHTSDWADGLFGVQITNADDMKNIVLTEANGFAPGVSYNADDLNNGQGDVTYSWDTATNTGNNVSSNGMSIQYSGSGGSPPNLDEYIAIDEVAEDLIFFVIGGSFFFLDADWSVMPPNVWAAAGGGGSGTGNMVGANPIIMINTQDGAQEALTRIDEAILRKDQIRAHLGALQNRLENTTTNLRIQAENIQAAESRISDVDVSSEMTEFVRRQILAQAAVAMLAQANSLPEMALSLIQ
jgi:flagellin